MPKSVSRFFARGIFLVKQGKPAIKRIALFGDGRNEYFHFMLRGLADGFRAHGIDAIYANRFFTPDEMGAFCDVFRPDAVLEINRTRSMTLGLPERVKHISWIQDPPHFHRNGDCITEAESDLNYFIAHPRSIGYKMKHGTHWGMLFTGVDPRFMYPAVTDFDHDFSIVASIHSNRYFAPPMSEKPIAPGTEVTWSEFISEYIGQFLRDFERARDGICDFDTLLFMADVILYRLSGRGYADLFASDDERIRFEEIVVFVLGPGTLRREIARRAIAVSQTTRIYGAKEWQSWPEFTSYYSHLVRDQEEMAGIYRASRAVLHTNANSFNMHSRVLDTMGAGGLVMVLTGLYDNVVGGIERYFTPFEHYIPYTLENFEAVAAEWCHPGKDEARRAIGRAASVEIHARHGWKERAGQVLKDLGEI